MKGQLVGAALVPGMPHLLAQNASAGWLSLAEAVRQLGDELREAGVESLLVVSTQWISVLGLTVQARPRLEGTRVDENWYRYEFGTIPYSLQTDVELSRLWLEELRQRNFQARPIDHPHFPVDTGLITVLKLLDPENRLAISQVSLNLYGTAEMSEQIGQAAVNASIRCGRRTAVVAIGGLSSHPWQRWIEPAQDAISNPNDESLNARVLELLKTGRIDELMASRAEMVAAGAMDGQLRTISFLHGAVGLAHPAQVRAYAPVWGMGAAVVSWPISHRNGVSE